MPKLVDADQRRGELADAAARVIAREGIDGASLRGVAAEAGWTTGTLVHYFASKRELLAFTLETSLAQRRTKHGDRTSATADQILRSMLFNALPTTASSRLHWIVTLAFAAQASADPELATIQRDAYLSFRSSVVTLLRDIPDIHHHGSDDADLEREAERLIALVDGIALQALFDPILWTNERQVHALEEGIGPNTARRRT